MQQPRQTIVLALAVVAAATVAQPLHTPLNNPNEGVRVFTVKALVEHHTFAIDDVVASWGFIDDKATRNGHLYQSKAPLPSLLAAAAYAVVHPFSGDLSRPTLTRLCRVAGGLVPVTLMVALTWWSLRRRQRADDDDDDDDNLTVDIIMVGLVLGTGVLASLNVFSGHAIAAVAPAAVLALARLPGPAPLWRCALAGIIVTTAATAEYPAALCVPLAWLVIRRSTRIAPALAVAIGAAVATALPTVLAHQLMWGAPWRTGYSFLDNPHYQPLVEGTFFGIGLPRPSVWVTTLVSPELGLFFFSPFLLLGLVGFVAWRASTWRRQDMVVVVVVVVGLLLFIGGFRGWRGGWSVGPRYVLELAGIFAVFAVDGVARLPRRVRIPLVVALVAASVLHSGLAGAFFPHLPDVLPAPVGELVLPLVARGFCPDSLPLWLGFSPGVAAALVAVVVVAPVFVAPALSGHRRAVVAGLVVVPLAFIEVATVAPTGARALEVRRVTDNWRPETGNPYLVDVPSAPVGTRIAVDRLRELNTRAIACTDQSRPRRADVGPGTGAVRAAVDALDGPRRLLIVDDVLASHLGAVGGAGVTMTISDFKKLPAIATRQPPCEGPISVLILPTTPLPPTLATRPVEHEASLGDFRWLRIGRGDRP